MGWTGQCAFQHRRSMTPLSLLATRFSLPVSCCHADSPRPPQTLGGRFQVDGRLQGAPDVQTIPCDTNTNACQIRVPAPGAAVVFFSADAQDAAGEGEGAQTFPTTALTKTRNTATIDPAVLATAQGMSGRDRSREGGTSPGGGANGAVRVGARGGAWVTGSVVMGALVGLSMCTRRLGLGL